MSKRIIFSGNVEQAFLDIIKSIAEEEAAICNILNLEKDIIQKAKSSARNIDEFIAINESINSIIKNVIKLQMLMQIKLEYIEEFLQKLEGFEENYEIEE